MPEENPEGFPDRIPEAIQGEIPRGSLEGTLGVFSEATPEGNLKSIPGGLS